MSRVVEVTCSLCGRSEMVKTSSRDASCSGAEALIEVINARGWSHGIGFAAILTGRYFPICPDCEERGDDNSADDDGVLARDLKH